MVGELTRVQTRLIVAVVAVQLGLSLRFFAKYAPVAPAAAYVLFVLVGVGLALVATRLPALVAVLSSRTVATLAPVGLVVALLYAYPRADGLSAVGGGSDQDDCIASLVHNVLALREPYSLSYLGHPCSTGPVELLPYLPVFLSRYWFAVVPALALALGHWVLSRLVDQPLARLLGLTQVVSLLFLELSATGSDFVLIGWLLAAAVVLARDGLRERSGVLVLLGGLAYVLFAGSRVPLAASAAGSLWLLAVLHGGRGVRLAIGVAVGTAATYLAGYLAGPTTFAPAHLFGKAGRLIGDLGAVGVGLAVLIAAGVAVVSLHPATRRLAERHYLGANLALVLLPMALAAAGELASKGYDLARWEGLNYLLLAVPVLMAAVAGRLGSGPVPGDDSTAPMARVVDRLPSPHGFVPPRQRSAPAHPSRRPAPVGSVGPALSDR